MALLDPFTKLPIADVGPGDVFSLGLWWHGEIGNFSDVGAVDDTGRLLMSAHFRITWSEPHEGIDKQYRSHGRTTWHDGGIFAFDRVAHIDLAYIPGSGGIDFSVLRIKGENTTRDAIDNSCSDDGYRKDSGAHRAISGLPGFTLYVDPPLAGFEFHENPMRYATHFSLTNPSDVLLTGKSSYTGSIGKFPLAPAGFAITTVAARAPAAPYVALRMHYGGD